MSVSPIRLPPLSLYLHIPWCERKCPYCDFNSHQRSATLPEAEYVQALLQDLRASRHYFQGRPLHSIFIGGGTPSLFSAQSYALLLDQIKQELPFDGDIEITLEANPGTFEQQKFADYRAAGINRLSIGIQSFNDRHLQQLGRIHGSDEARRAADIARSAGFDNFNLDLMFGLPSQTTAQALDDLQLAMACEPTHLSWYQLTIEPNTEYFRRPPVLPQDDAIAQMQEAGISLLAEKNYHRYEISAYSQPGRQARHNLNYWEFGDYLGIGAGAHGKITLPDAQTIVRTRKTRMPAHYLGAARYAQGQHKLISSSRRSTSIAPDANHMSPSPFTAETVAVGQQQLPLEFMMNALRLCEGVPRHLYAERTGLDAAQLQAVFERLRQRQLLAGDDNRIRPSAKGLQFLNDLLVEFL